MSDVTLITPFVIQTPRDANSEKALVVGPLYHNYDCEIKGNNNRYYGSTSNFIV